MRKELLTGLAATVALLAPLGASAASVMIDGNFTDWGIANNGTTAGWTPKSGVVYTVEDQSNAMNGFLSPGWGGQAYDAEALYVTWQTKADGKTYLDVGIVTGHDPSTATTANSYGRGDIAIDFGKNGSWDFGILTANRSATLLRGDVVATANADWSTGLWSSPGVFAPESSPYVTKVASGTDVGNASVAISNAFTNMGILGGNHWFYEVEIPVDAFGSHWHGMNPSEAFSIQWTMLCANDIVALNVAATTVPEPAIPALVLTGLALAGLTRRRTPH